MKTSKNYYDSIALKYKVQVNHRLNYLDAVDTYIINTVSNCEIENYLDIGTGDGRRAFKFIEASRIKGSIVLVDDSKRMLENVNSYKNITLFNDSIFNFKSNMKFDVITCLWNVLGHFDSKQSRMDFFKLIETNLKPNGVFIFDVNNRYNISHYGFENVSNNLKGDHLGNKDSGWFVLGDHDDTTKVYIHSPFDIFDYLKDTNLLLEETIYKDYTTGENKPTFFEGQLVYKLRKQF